VSSIQQLVERSALRAEIRRRSGQRPRPCIAISRMPGTTAAILAADVAARLDFEFFGNEIVEKMIREEGLQSDLAKNLDEHVRSSIDRYLLDAFRTGTLLESDYIRALVKTVTSIGALGSAILLGRGSNYILPADRTLRVLVVAPRETRLARLAEARKLSHEEAARELAQEEERRRAFVRQYFKADADDASHFDLAVNPDSLSREIACDVVVAAYRGRFEHEGKGSSA
jgi:cytidylate kinase